jgi:FkbM family methyltransferase
MLIDFRELFPKYGIKPNGVLHVGANVGEEAPVYDELGIKSVCWVEANHDIYLKLVNNIEKYPGQIAFCFAAGDEEGESELNVSNNGSQSSSILELGTHLIAHPDVHYTHKMQVVMRRLDHLFDPHPYDFLNMDIQGYELKALKGMGQMLHQFKWAYLEVNREELYKGCALVEDIDFYLSSFGFRRVETKWVGNTGWGDALYIK